MSDTPRTDKLYEEVWRFTNETDAVDALISMRDFCRELERELNVANNWVEHHQNHCDDLMKENSALRELTSTMGAPAHINIPVEKWRELRADKERLDWLLTGDGGFWVNWMYDKDEWTPELKASRDAIDACRNGRIGREKP